jgi:CrcB protein
LWAAFTIGFLTLVFLKKECRTLRTRAPLLTITGILGGFTTFSAFSLDFVTLVERKAIRAGRGLCGLAP